MSLKVPKIKDSYELVRCSATMVSTCNDLSGLMLHTISLPFLLHFGVF